MLVVDSGCLQQYKPGQHNGNADMSLPETPTDIPMPGETVTSIRHAAFSSSHCRADWTMDHP